MSIASNSSLSFEDFDSQGTAEYPTLFENIFTFVARISDESNVACIQSTKSQAHTQQSAVTFTAHKDTITILNRMLRLMSNHNFLTDWSGPTMIVKFLDQKLFFRTDQFSLPEFFNGLDIKFTINTTEFPNDNVKILCV